MTIYSVELQNVFKQFSDIIAVKNISLQIKKGEFFSLLGPSGCGKTTTLRMIAGFEQPDKGQIYLKGKPVTHLPPFKRNVNTVFQDYALFPHMTVVQNIRFGLEMKNLPKAEIKKRVSQVLETVHLSRLEHRRPAQLSGGQQQRVALARAIVNQPDVLLLDEPLSALDLKLRQAMRLELKHLQRQLGITFIFVTHDQEEAMFMSDRIAVMRQGVIEQVGSPAEIYNQPVNRYVADFIGETNFFDGYVQEAANGMARVVVGQEMEWEVACAPTVKAGERGSVIIRPEKVNIHIRKPEPTDQMTVVLGIIVEKVWIGTDTLFIISLENGLPIQVRHQNMALGDPVAQLAADDKVYLSWQKNAARVLTS